MDGKKSGVYPNPFINKINLMNEDGNEEYSLVNCFGQSIWKGRYIEQQDFPARAPGVYFLKVPA